MKKVRKHFQQQGKESIKFKSITWTEIPQQEIVEIYSKEMEKCWRRQMTAVQLLLLESNRLLLRIENHQRLRETC